MSDHGMFVLAAYGLAFVVLGVLCLASWRGHVQARREVARLEALMPARNR
jgi:heme exporter protein CcmD